MCENNVRTSDKKQTTNGKKERKEPSFEGSYDSWKGVSDVTANVVDSDVGEAVGLRLGQLAVADVHDLVEQFADSRVGRDTGGGIGTAALDAHEEFGDVKEFFLLRDRDFILLRPGNNLYDRSMKMFEDSGVTPRVRLSLSQLVTAFHLAEKGLGTAFVSDRLVKAPTPGLCYFLPDSPEAERQFHFIFPPRTYTPFAVNEFIRFTKAYC